MIGAALTGLVLAGGLTRSISPVDTIHVSATASIGTGVSIARFREREDIPTDAQDSMADDIVVSNSPLAPPTIDELKEIDSKSDPTPEKDDPYAVPQTFRNRSPTILNLGINLSIPRFPWLEFSPGIQLELLRSVAIRPRLRVNLPTRYVGVNAFLGGSLFVRPFKMYGAEMGLGVHVPVSDRIGVVGDFSATTYLAGDDIMPNTPLVKLDFGIGAKVKF